MKPQLSRTDLHSVVKLSLEDVGDEVIKALVDVGEVVEFQSRDLVIHQGDLSSDVYLLITGRLMVSITTSDDSTSTIGEIAAGEFFGEMALFTGEARSTGVFAARHSILLKFEGDKFHVLLDQHASLTKRLSTTLIKRLSQSNSGVAKSKLAKNIAIVGIDSSYDIWSFCQEAITSFSSFGKVLFVSEELVSGLDFWRDDISEAELNSRFSHWLYTSERDYDFIVLLVGANPSAWARTALGQADTLLLVGRKDRSESLSPVETEILVPLRMSEIRDVFLVLDSRGVSSEASVAMCIDNRDVKSFVHLGGPDDFKRLARLISGNSIKLVLGGGGAKGFAHLGVYKAFMELGIPIDFIGGTSIGAIMGATLALGWTYDEIVDAAYTSFVVRNPLKDYHIPLVSVFSANKLEKELYSRFGDMDIADLKIPFFSVAANLTKMSTEILDRGLVKNAVRASVSLPSVLPPYVHGNDLLLDGGIVDNLPYDHMQKLGEGPTIGVDLSFIKERKLGYNKVPKSSTLILDKIRGRNRYKVPNIHQIMMGTMTLASNERRVKNKHKFELYLQPDVYKFGFLKWDGFYEIIEAGYNASIEPLRKWKAENSHLF